MVTRLVLIGAISMLLLSILLGLTLKQVPAYALMLAPVLEIACLFYLFHKPHWFSLKANIYFESPVWGTIILVTLLCFYY